jgi:hypothetical protein
LTGASTLAKRVAVDLAGFGTVGIGVELADLHVGTNATELARVRSYSG